MNKAKTRAEKAAEKYNIGDVYRYCDPIELKESKIKKVTVWGQNITIELENHYNTTLFIK